MKIIAFIPVRGGSKSIPLKNIKPLCGKPLVNWSIEALERCQLVDEIIVATDSDEIEAVVTREAFQKTKVYRRKPENAQDSSSTERESPIFFFMNSSRSLIAVTFIRSFHQRMISASFSNFSLLLISIYFHF